MQITNLLQMNDWEIKKFLRVILAIQLAMSGIIGLDIEGLHIPIIRPLISFIYLTFTPGIIILRILKLHKLGSIETLLYAAGLSIATLMFTGLFMNIAYPFFGISRPLSTVPLTITISVVLLILCILSYMRDKDFCGPNLIDIKNVLSPPALFLSLIPFLAIFGTYLVNFYNINTLLIFMIVVIVSIVLLIGFDKLISSKFYPLAVFVISLSLLLHNSLISMYIWGADIHYEYYFSNLVMTNAFWDSTIPVATNAMLSIVMLAPILSNISGISLTWVFKIIYPAIFSLMPLGLYQLFQKKTDDKIAFLSVFFFMSLFTFYNEMLALARQQIAELFLVLLILLVFNKDIYKVGKNGLIIVFSSSLAVSHYGLSYIYKIIFIAVWFILILSENSKIQKLMHDFYSKFSRYKGKVLIDNLTLSKIKDRAITSTFALQFVVFALTWYMYISSSSAFVSIVQIGDHIVNSFFTDFLNRQTTEGLDFMMMEAGSPLHHVTKYLHLITQSFIAVGIVALLLKSNKKEFEREYSVFAGANCMILFASIAVPFFAISLNTTRLYQITLIFLAPFFVTGGVIVFRILSSIFRESWTNQHIKSSLKVLSVFLIIFFLFNNGFVYEVARDNPTSISISQKSIKTDGSAKDKSRFYSVLNTFEQDFFSARWFDNNVNQEADYTKVYTDYISSYPLISYGMVVTDHQRILSDTITSIEPDAFVFLGHSNVVEKVIKVRPEGLTTFNATELSPIFNINELSPFLRSINKIYANGGSEIYVGGSAHKPVGVN